MKKLLEEILEAAHQELKMHVEKLRSDRKRGCASRVRKMKQILSDTIRRVDRMMQGDLRRRFHMLTLVRDCLVFTKPSVFGPEHAEPLGRALDMAFSPEGDLGKIDDVLLQAKLEVVPQAEEKDS